MYDGNPPIDYHTTIENIFVPTTLLIDNNAYSLQIIASDLVGASISSNEITFYTDSLPEPPLVFERISPPFGADGLSTDITFLWHSTTDPDPLEEIEYVLYYSPRVDFSQTPIPWEWVIHNVGNDTSITTQVEDNTFYYWTVFAEDNDGFSTSPPNYWTFLVGTLSIEGEAIPEVFALHQNYPNPFNPITTLRYDLPVDAKVNITIYDLMGRSIRSLVNSQQTAGYRSIQWNATNNLGEPVSAGMYIYMIQAGEFRQVRKMVLLK